METLLNEIYNYIITLINSSTIYGPIIACVLIFLESILPVLPLFVFITILFIAFGPLLGFILAYTLTCLGCLFSFYLFRRLLKNFFENKIRKSKKINKLMILIEKLDINSLTLIIAVPFTPAFLINITAGLSQIDFKKYLTALLIGKVSLVAFWGFIGTSLIESLKNPRIIIIIVIMLAISFYISKLITKKFKFE